MIAPGRTAKTCCNDIKRYIEENNALVISVNFMYDSVKTDYMYFSNVKRYQYWSNVPETKSINKILTSNVTLNPRENEYVVSFTKLVKCGWEHMDNSAILLLRLLDGLNVKSIAIAGLDGFEYNLKNTDNYVSPEMELANINDASKLLNKEISEMLKDFMETKTGDENVIFITPSRFDFLGNNNYD